jgi:hypothetical protein
MRGKYSRARVPTLSFSILEKPLVAPLWHKFLSKAEARDKQTYLEQKIPSVTRRVDKTLCPNYNQNL